MGFSSTFDIILLKAVRAVDAHLAPMAHRNNASEKRWGFLLPNYQTWRCGECVGRCGIIPLRPVLDGEAEATAREHAARRDARLQPFGRARENGVAHWPVSRSRPVMHLRERPVTA